jgi:hypothetical protein
MYYSYVEIEYVATSFSPARMDLALKLLNRYTPVNVTALAPLVVVVVSSSAWHFALRGLVKVDG